MPENPRTRQVQTALVWSALVLFVLALHLSPTGASVVWLAAGLTGLYAVRVLFALSPRPKSDPAYRPRVSVLVAAKNEQAVAAQLVVMLRRLDYPDFEVWIADDGSTDCTYQRLLEAGRGWPALHLVRRIPERSRPGKSAVLNELRERATGDILVVFDADARVEPDFLSRTVPLFAVSSVGALQVRKRIHNANFNYWTRGQSAEMLLDAFYQQQRAAIGGTAELRGNGQLVRAAALEAVGGWNEATVTDDLDLTLRLHLGGWQIAFASDPCVDEEGVTTWSALWRQRSRWAEGGFQRYLDYAPRLLARAMGTTKTLDQLIFCTIQYLMPVAAVVDLLFALRRGAAPLLAPLVLVATVFTICGFYFGQREREVAAGRAAIEALAGTIYFLHWFPVILVKLARMALEPKKLVWLKTAHQGDYGTADSRP